MPYAVNGIGTGVVRTSRKRKVEGHTQFDAIEAFMFFEIPIVPYKVIHVLSMTLLSDGERYQSMPLRFSSKIILMAYLNGWGIGLSWLCGALATVLTVMALTMERAVLNGEITCLVVLWILAFVGLCLKITWYFWSGRDERIVAIMGSHEFGTSDPFYWQSQLAADVAEAILRDLSQNRLIDKAQTCLQEGDLASALYLARIAMRTENRAEAGAVSVQILAANR